MKKPLEPGQILKKNYHTIDHRESYLPHQPIANHFWMKVSHKERQPFQFWAVRIHPLPCTFFKSSVHRAAGHPTLRRPNRDLHSRPFRPHRRSVWLETWLAHFNFSLLIRRTMSVTLALPYPKYIYTYLQIKMFLKF